MSVFASSRKIFVSPKVIDIVSGKVSDRLKAEGYETVVQKLSSGNTEISITKGGAFKAVVGMKTALKVTLTPIDETSFLVEAGVGLFGLQAIPTVGMLFIAWPILIPQIWGLIKQAQLDDYILDIIDEYAAQAVQNLSHKKGVQHYCPKCGYEIDKTTKFCTACGAATDY
jgi:bacterioferritin-associated ferredoxin